MARRRRGERRKPKRRDRKKVANKIVERTSTPSEDSFTMHGFVVSQPAGRFVEVDLPRTRHLNVMARKNGVTLTNGDLVVLRCGRGAPVIEQRVDADPADYPGAKYLPGLETGQSFVLRPAVFSGTYQAGRWRTDTDEIWVGTWNGVESMGAAWWGDWPRACLETMANMQVWDTQAAKWMRVGFYWQNGTGDVPTYVRMVLLAGTEPPADGSEPVELRSVQIPAYDVAGSLWVTHDVPVSWQADIRSGVAGGIGFKIDPAWPDEGRGRIWSPRLTPYW